MCIGGENEDVTFQLGTLQCGAFGDSRHMAKGRRELREEEERKKERKKKHRYSGLAHHAALRQRSEVVVKAAAGSGQTCLAQQKL